jgi:hypothetical protein
MNETSVRHRICQRHATADPDHVASLLQDGYTMQAAQKIERLERTEMLLGELVDAGVATDEEEDRMEVIDAQIRAAHIEHRPQGEVSSIDPTPWTAARGRSGRLVDPPAPYDA